MDVFKHFSWLWWCDCCGWCFHRWFYVKVFQFSCLWETLPKWIVTIWPPYCCILIIHGFIHFLFIFCTKLWTVLDILKLNYVYLCCGDVECQETRLQMSKKHNTNPQGALLQACPSSRKIWDFVDKTIWHIALYWLGYLGNIRMDEQVKGLIWHDCCDKLISIDDPSYH